MVKTVDYYHVSIGEGRELVSIRHSMFVTACTTKHNHDNTLMFSEIKMKQAKSFGRCYCILTY